MSIQEEACAISHFYVNTVNVTTASLKVNLMSHLHPQLITLQLRNVSGFVRNGLDKVFNVNVTKRRPYQGFTLI